MIREVDPMSADYIESVFVTPRSEQVDKVFVAFYDKMSLNAVVNRGMEQSPPAHGLDLSIMMTISY